jgi:hypothetical protein
MENFEKLLQKELDKLPYTKHLDDGQYNDGKLAGFELGARWALSLIVVGRSKQLPKKSCHHACSPSDFHMGGKCDKMGCYQG